MALNAKLGPPTNNDVGLGEIATEIGPPPPPPPPPFMLSKLQPPTLSRRATEQMSLITGKVHTVFMAASGAKGLRRRNSRGRNTLQLVKRHLRQSAAKKSHWFFRSLASTRKGITIIPSASPWLQHSWERRSRALSPNLLTFRPAAYNRIIPMTICFVPSNPEPELTSPWS